MLVGKSGMEWIYLSPHLDDIALSCGGLVWEQVHSGSQVSIWTICAGDPPSQAYSDFARSFHERWGTGVWAVATRRAEDIVSCARLGAAHRHFPILIASIVLIPRRVSLYISQKRICSVVYTHRRGV